MGIPDHLACLLRNLYAGQEATVRIGCRTTDWFKTGKGTCQDYILSPCLFNFHAEYIMQNAGLDESQARIKIVRRSIKNLRYADDITLKAESEKKLKSLLRRVKEESEPQSFGHLMGRVSSLEKPLMLVKTEGKRRRGQQKMRRWDSITDSVDMDLGKL